MQRFSRHPEVAAKRPSKGAGPGLRAASFEARAARGHLKRWRRQMAKRDEPYVYVIVESYYPASTAGLHGPVHIRPVEGQPFPTHLHVECSKTLSNPRRYPVGSTFKIRAKLTDKLGRGEFLYSYFGWHYEVVGKPKNSN
jgi:hypothetical protein